MKLKRFGVPSPLLSICVPSLDAYSGRVQRLMNSASVHTHVPYEVCVADCEGELLGYTKPMNAAMAAAHGKILVAVNDDVTFAPGWFEALQAPLVLPSGNWCTTPDAAHTDGPQVYHPWLQVWRREAWEEIGGMDEQFVFWCSDIDLARRLIDANRPPVKVRLSCPVHHELNATAAEHPEKLGQICVRDLERFRAKWGIGAEEEKHRLAGL